MANCDGNSNDTGSFAFATVSMNQPLGSTTLSECERENDIAFRLAISILLHIDYATPLRALRLLIFKEY